MSMSQTDPEVHTATTVATEPTRGTYRVLWDALRWRWGTKRRAGTNVQIIPVVLQDEADFFDANRERWVAEGHVGQFVLIREQTPQFFPTLRAAYEAGLEQLGDTDYFIRQVTREREVHYLPSILGG